MTNVADKQTFVISTALILMNPANKLSQVQLPMNLRFAADELILKSITYNNNVIVFPDISSTVGIWCNVTNDGLIGSFPNSHNASFHHDEHFRINNTFQTGNFVLQFLQTDTANPSTYNPQALISAQNSQRTFGTVTLTIEFVKLIDKSLY